MNYIKKIFIFVLILFPILYFFPWWTGVIYCLIIGAFAENNKSAIQLSSSTLTVAWAIILIYRWIIGGEILMARVATMMNVNNSFILAFAILLLPIIIGGLSGLTGKLIRNAIN
jgi:hypothetical protein